jgi:predicted hydrolase (HD superfamily)
MSIPSRKDAQTLLEKHVVNSYQRTHAAMVARAMEGYAEYFDSDTDLWFVTGLLHDIDFEKHPDEHPGPSLEWFKNWGYPEELIHAVEAHAYGYNGFTTEPKTKLAATLLACDEISGIFYAYKQINPIPYGEMKTSSIRKRLNEKAFAAKIDRSSIYKGCEKLDIDLDTHIDNLKHFFSTSDEKDFL